MTLEEKAKEYSEKECKNCTYRCDKPKVFKRLSNKKECHAYFRSYEGYLAGYKEALKAKVNITTISDAPLMEREQLEQAKEIIKNLLILKDDHFGNTKMEWRVEVTEQAEQFLKEIEK